MYYIKTIKRERSTANTYERNLLDEKYAIDRHQCHMAARLDVFVDEDQSKLSMLYGLPKLHKILAHVLLMICL